MKKKIFSGKKPVYTYVGTIRKCPLKLFFKASPKLN